MPKPRTRFLTAWLLSVATLLSVTAIANYIVDPYLIFNSPRIQGFNSRKPAVDTRQRMMKVFELQVVKPRTLILGSSRVEIGIDARGENWPAPLRPVYNLAISAGGPYIALRYLQHALALEKVDLVVVGLDFEFFIGNQPVFAKKSDFSRLRVSEDGTPNTAWRRERVNDLLVATLSLDAFSDSVTTVLANRTSYSSDLTSGDWRRIYFLHPEDFGGFYPRWVLEDFTKVPGFIGLSGSNTAMEDVKRIIELCRSYKTQAIFFINPYHADLLETFSVTGNWTAFEQWKRDLLGLTGGYSNKEADTPVPLWDFSDYDRYSTESVKPGQQGLRWYVSPSHYSTALGDKVIASLLNSNTPPFGLILSNDNIDSHLMEIRQHQRNYRDAHPADAKRIMAIYERALGSVQQH